MGAQSREAPGSPHEPSPVKKAYAAPALVTWGTLRELTKHVGHSGKADGGKSKNFTKTR